MCRLFLAACLAVAVGWSDGPRAPESQSLGSCDETVIRPCDRECPGGTLFHNYEELVDAIGWGWEGIQPPYYGAFGEAYDLGEGTIDCATLWVTQMGDFTGQSVDLYVWDGGIDGPPGVVLALMPDRICENVPFWADIGQNDFPWGVPVEGPFTVGYWGNWPGEVCGFLIAHDMSCSGHPWTYVAPGIGYGTGWIDPSDVWGVVSSLGLGGFFSPRTSSVEDFPAPDGSTQASTWGSIKRLFE